MTEDSIKDLALYKLNAETYQEKYHQTEYEKEKFREEARLSKNQLELTEKALKDANEKNKAYEDKIKTLENSLHTYELLKHRSQAAVIGLQKVARESQDNVIQLETRLRNLTVNQNSEQEQLRNMVKESNEFRLELGRRVGLSDTKADYNDLMGKCLDEAALFEFKYIQSESNLKRAITELDTLKQSTQGMTKRSEDYLQERKVQSEAGNNFQNKVLELQNQFEAQHKAGLAVNAELKQARERVQQAETDCAQMQSELTGLRLLHKQDQTFKENVSCIHVLNYFRLLVNEQNETEPLLNV
ncbi:unnamed protein product [Trichobilharzia regenti]|nr:unnamed protein product [Trichobilharzia regenti]